jgi:hypothetical protein
LVILLPIVLTILHPPIAVPNPIAVYAAISTQSGIRSAVGRCRWRSHPVYFTNRLWVDTSRPTMIPMVFWASLAP